MRTGQGAGQQALSGRMEAAAAAAAAVGEAPAAEVLEAAEEEEEEVLAEAVMTWMIILADVARFYSRVKKVGEDSLV